MMDWTSSVDGSLGTGATVNTLLTVGVHQLTATVVDSEGASPVSPARISTTVLADSDADGMADDWEALYSITDPLADADNDSLTNLDEYLAGSNPIDAAPVVAILSPGTDSSFDSSLSINFTASASDAEDGDISHAVLWSSDVDGSLGSGASLASLLSAGAHIITATVTDSQGAMPVTQAAINLSITEGIAGDITGNGVVDIADLLLLQRHLTGSVSLDASAIARGDLFPAVADGELTISDLLLLQQILVSQ
ncbi:MAG TPA: hypothetical protein ENI05_09675 [Porticoccus sp.]|nr:hypothetical protein [Porticoccus sp.]